MIYATIFFLDNIFVHFGSNVFRPIAGIPIGTNCAPLIVDLFCYSYASQFIIKLKNIHLSTYL
jgi:hypothetical protein